MRILITGATGYIGKRLISVLLKEGHTLVCTYRGDQTRTNRLTVNDNIQWIKYDFLDRDRMVEHTLSCDVAYYLIHAMRSHNKDFEQLEMEMTKHFLELTDQLGVTKIIYLSGIVNSKQKLSPHFRSRWNVEKILRQGSTPVITLRAGIIVGSGSASFEIIRDLVEKLPIMIAPKWLNTKCQPISIRDVLYYLAKVVKLHSNESISFDIGGPEVLTYKEMLSQYAEVRKLSRWICTIPVMTPKLSSYWLYFITSTSYNLAINLVESMKIDVVCENHQIVKLFPNQLLSFKQAVSLSLNRYKKNSVVSKWTDAHLFNHIYQTIDKENLHETYGGYQQLFKREISLDQKKTIKNRIWSIGGERGWYYGTKLWRFRAIIDKLVGGVGNRKRNNESLLKKGEALDMWRIIDIKDNPPMLLLQAEAKLPGKAYLQFEIEENNQRYYYTQKNIFYPHGLWGRIYWKVLSPIHYWLFRGMGKKICSKKRML